MLALRKEGISDICELIYWALLPLYLFSKAIESHDSRTCDLPPPLQEVLREYLVLHQELGSASRIQEFINAAIVRFLTLLCLSASMPGRLLLLRLLSTTRSG
jgi:hypothetical protein